MESAASKQAAELQHQIELRRRIASLQSQLVDLPQLNASPKRKQTDQILAPATPSPKKKRKLEHSPPRATLQPSIKPNNAPAKQIAKPQPSNLLSKLAALEKKAKEAEEEGTSRVIRSSGFAETPAVSAKRDDDLALVEEFDIGPADHTAPFDDPNFDRLEPNSGIRLSSRTMPHEDLEEYLRGRYYISPSRLYSAVRLLPNKQGYDVPVEGDWVTIAVVAERGPVRYTKAPVGIDREADEKKQHQHKGKKPDDDKPEKPSGKKFVNLKLVDFGSRSKSSASGGKSVIRGDALLTLLVFESDGVDTVKREADGKPEKVYRGGSRGAFEQISKWKEGDVIALLNPKILKPYQRSTDQPHPQNNILAVTPESAASIAIIGRSKDLGMCEAEKRDGKLCRAWVDKRVGDVCEYHIQNAVKRQRASRPEFSSGTSGMSTTARHNRKSTTSTYDPARQYGLKPNESNGSTYHFAGHIASTSIWATENIGREGQAKAQRKQQAREADRALKALLKHDDDGMKAVLAAREGLKAPKKGKQPETAESSSSAAAKKGYSAQVIQALGFDPAASKVGGGANQRKESSQNKLEALAALHAQRKDVSLGPPPGQPKIRSGVVAPPSLKTKKLGGLEDGDEEMVDLDSDSD